jgi:cytochrome c oxidase subunit 2
MPGRFPGTFLTKSIGLRMLPCAIFLHTTSAIATPPPICTDGAAASPTMFVPRSTPAEMILDVSWFVWSICTVIFVIMAGLMLWCIIKYRQRSGDTTEAPQIYGSNPIELAWTVIPTVIVFILFLVSARTIFEIDKSTAPENSLNVTVVGHQWWWEFNYLDQGFVTAGELHVPLTRNGEPTSIFLTLESNDVIHSFWVPQLGGKNDVVPNHINHLWLEPNMTGTYVGQCAEYCGTQHANMLITVVVHEEAAWDAWVANQKSNSIEDADVIAGHDLFLQTACINCHRIRGTIANGNFAPDLTHLMSRATIGSGVVANTKDNLLAWVNDPQVVKPGARMPSMKLNPKEVDQIVAYLLTLK